MKKISITSWQEVRTILLVQAIEHDTIPTWLVSPMDCAQCGLHLGEKTCVALLTKAGKHFVHHHCFEQLEEAE